VAAIIQPADHPQTLSEKDWNQFSTKEVEVNGKAAAAVHKYRASKTLAERGMFQRDFLFQEFFIVLAIDVSGMGFCKAA
jgi:hypothetical protein